MLNSRRISGVATEFEISREMIANADEMVGGIFFLFTIQSGFNHSPFW